MRVWLILLAIFTNWFFFQATVAAAGILDILDRASISGERPDVPEVAEGGTPGAKFLIVFLTAVEVILFVAGIAAVVMIVAAGVRLTFSIGIEEQIEASKRMLIYAVLGLLAVFLSFFVVQNITTIFV
jgi:hypothetical protein